MPFRFPPLRANRSGSIVLVVAIGLPILIMLIGGAVDFARAFYLQGKAQTAADAAVFSLARAVIENRQNDVTDKRRDEIARGFFEAQLGKDIPTTYEVSTKRNKRERMTTLFATSQIPTTFLRIIGLKQIPVEVEATAQYELENFAVEVAFVINTSNSMNTTRKAEGLANALDQIFTKFETFNRISRDRVRVSIVPFQLGVRPTSIDHSQFKLVGRATFLDPADIISFCVVDRDPTYNVTVPTVSPGFPMTAHPVFPMTPEVDWSPFCSTSPTNWILQLTTDMALAKSRIPAPTTVAGVNGALGLSWGWGMLTPGAPFSTSGIIPLRPDHTSLKRVLIYMTDGENTGNYFGASASLIDDWSLTICQGIKASGIYITTINIDGQGSEAFLQACASSPDRYLKVPAPNLPKILEEIAEEVSGITPVRLVE